MKHLRSSLLSLSLFIVFGFFGPLVTTVSAAASGDADVFGSIQAPAGVAAYNAQAGTGGIGLMIFFSNLVRLITIGAGLWVFVNFLLAGFTYVTAAGDSGATKKVYDKIIMSVIGLGIIVASYTLTGMVSLMLFGRADFILNPTLIGVT